VFEENLREINEHNSKLGKSYSMGINQFTGLTKAEFAETYLSVFAPSESYNPIVE